MGADGRHALPVGRLGQRERRTLHPHRSRGKPGVDRLGRHVQRRVVHAEPRERDGGVERWVVEALRFERVAGLVAQEPGDVVSLGERAVERVEERADLGERVRHQPAAGRREQPCAPPAGVGVGARGVEEDGAGSAEGGGEHGV